MNTESSKELDCIDGQSESDFYAFLLKKAELYGFEESKRLYWSQYMMDTSRGKRTVKHILDYFKINYPESYKVLDIGCGFGSLLITLQHHFERVCGIDIDDERVQWAKKRASGSDVICGNATKLPWPDGEFDLVISTDVFEHISYEEQHQAASDLLRVLKPGGRGYLEVPNRFQLLDEHNRVWFGTWLPDSVHEKYVKFILKNESYVPCWERTGKGWKHLFKSQGFQVSIEPHFFNGHTYLKYFLIPPNRYKIYLTK